MNYFGAMLKFPFNELSSAEVVRPYAFCCVLGNVFGDAANDSDPYSPEAA